MRIEHNNKVYFIDWKYENPELLEILRVKGISEQEFREMKFEDACKVLNLTQMPSPKFTLCVIKDEQKVPVVQERSIRHHNDQFCKEKGRRYSFGRALRVMFPGRENKQERNKFWQQYLNRK